MAIPDFQSVMRPVLTAVQNGAPLPLNELREWVADQFQLTEDERKERLPSGHQTVINNRVGWARTYLNKAGLLTIPAKGMVQITSRGLDALANGPERITVAWLKQFPEFADFHTVHRPEIDKFIGALTHQRARKGVFITTSEFSAGAREAALGLDIKVVLIDGVELARLMVENNLGVSVKQVYEVKQLDSDYFAED